MPESRRTYRVSSPGVNELNLVLSEIGARLDEIEGYRGNPTLRGETTFVRPTTFQDSPVFENGVLTIGDLTYTFPASHGGANYYLSNDGSGGLSFIEDTSSMVTLVRKTADESLLSSTTLQDDNELALSFGASDIWAVEVFVIFSENGGDIKLGWSGPSGATFQWQSLGNLVGVDVASTPVAILTISGSLSVGGLGAVGNTGVVVKGIYVGGGTAGTLQFRWAQASLSGNNTIVRTNSFIQAVQIA